MDLLSGRPFPLIELIRFINQDYLTCMKYNLIKTTEIDAYKDQAVKILLYSVPFAAFIGSE
jgi:hypothetical protein